MLRKRYNTNPLKSDRHRILRERLLRQLPSNMKSAIYDILQ